ALTIKPQFRMGFSDFMVRWIRHSYLRHNGARYHLKIKKCRKILCLHALLLTFVHAGSVLPQPLIPDAFTATHLKPYWGGPCSSPKKNARVLNGFTQFIPACKPNRALADCWILYHQPRRQDRGGGRGGRDFRWHSHRPRRM